MLGILLVGRESILCTSESVFFVVFLSIPHWCSCSSEQLYLFFCLVTKYCFLCVELQGIFFIPFKNAFLKKAIVQLIQPVPFYLWHFSALQNIDKVIHML